MSWQQDRRAPSGDPAAVGARPVAGSDPGHSGPDQRALARGAIACTRAYGEQVGPYFCCPWSSIFLVKRPVRIGARRLRPMQQFTFDVSAEGLAEGEALKRELLLFSQPAEGN